MESKKTCSFSIVWAVGKAGGGGFLPPHIYICPKKFWEKHHVLWDGYYPQEVRDDLARAGFVETAESVYELVSGIQADEKDFPTLLAEIPYMEFSPELQAFIQER